MKAMEPQAITTSALPVGGLGPVLISAGPLPETPKAGARPIPFSRTMVSMDHHNAQGAPSSTTGKVRSYFRWSAEEEDELRRAVEQFGRKDWELIRVCPDFPLLR